MPRVARPWHERWALALTLVAALLAGALALAADGATRAAAVVSMAVALGVFVQGVRRPGWLVFAL